MTIAIRSTKFIQEVQFIVRDNLSNNNLNGAFIAQELGLSRMHLHRKLKIHCGKNASQFINIHRIEYAQDALKKSRSSIQEIALESGFSNLPYFCKVFREIKNVTPSQYRKHHF